MIIDYNVISKSSPNFNKFVTLYEQAFVADERRETSALISIINNCKEFRVVEASTGNVFLGFFSYWTFVDCGFAYCEHFAIEPEARNGGIGSKLLRHVLDTLTMPLILEVEPEDTPIARRRIEFYRRSGLTIWNDVDYTQPPYAPGKASLQMKLMTSRGFDSESQVREAAKVIKERVYGCTQE